MADNVIFCCPLKITVRVINRLGRGFTVPLTFEVDYIDRPVTVQCSAENPLILVVLWMQQAELDPSDPGDVDPLPT